MDYSDQEEKQSQNKDSALSRDYFQIYKKVNKNLYEKYSSSQNYYYTREESTKSWIQYKDFCHFDDESEQYFQEFYSISIYDRKIAYLTEYYKFHNDIPRLFMDPLNHIMNYYHDKQRKIKYVKITRMLQMQQQQQQKDQRKS